MSLNNATVIEIGVPGLQGPEGTDGSVWRNGSGAPAAGLGADGDYYLDTATGDVYAKAAGAYTVQGNIKGPAGSGGTADLGAILLYMEALT
jgi:hypothetical protein